MAQTYNIRSILYFGVSICPLFLRNRLSPFAWFQTSTVSHQAWSWERQFRSGAKLADQGPPGLEQTTIQQVTHTLLACARVFQHARGRVEGGIPEWASVGGRNVRSLLQHDGEYRQLLTSRSCHAIGLRSSGMPPHASLRRATVVDLAQSSQRKQGDGH